MMYLIALASAALYGSADFLGGLASRTTSTTLVVATSQTAGLVILLLAIGLLPTADPSAADLAWGTVAGLAGSFGVALLYRALAIGVMGVVAPITAVCAVVIPVLVGVIRGDRPGPLVLLGILLALVAIVLVGQQGPVIGTAPGRTAPGRLPAGVPHALASGVAIGVFFLLLAQARPESGLWPLVGARAVAIPMCLVAGLVGGVSFRSVSAPMVRMASAAGVVDMTANVLYLLASRMGALAVAVTLSSLYPASTVLLARVVLGERLRRLQVVGMVCALVAVVCIVLGGAR